MKKVSTLLFFSILFITAELAAQVLLHTADIQQPWLMNMDETGHIYTVSAKRNITKYDLSLNELGTFRALKNGTIQILDANNPLEIIYYQPAFNRLTIIDRLLTPKLELDFNSYNQQNISAIGQSLDGQYWIFDQLNMQLIKYNKQYDEVLKSNDLRLTGFSEFEPQYIEETAAGVLAFDRYSGFILFDRMGNIINYNRQDQQPDKMHLLNDHYLFIREKKVSIVKKDLLTEVFTYVHEQKVIDARIYRDVLVVLDVSGLKVYSLKEEIEKADLGRY